jgi:hypothetical protein
MTVTTIAVLVAGSIMLWGALMYLRNNWLFDKVLQLAGTPEYAPFREGAYEWVFWRWWRWDLGAAIIAWRAEREKQDAKA